MAGKAQLDIEGTAVEVSNLDKVLYPRSGFTKKQIIDYYIRISPYLLPHLAKRPITLKRYPDGVDGFFFYEKNCPPHPEWVPTVRVPRSEGGEISYCVMNSLPVLVWAVNLADLELHTFLHKAPALGRPTALAFDLDPGAPADLLSCCAVGLRLKDLLQAVGLKSFPKTSGMKGLQVFVPLNTAVTYEKTKTFAHAVAEILQQQSPALVVSKMQKALRKGKVLVDWSQNDRHKTTINVYSLRAAARPSVSTPLEWEEVLKAVQSKQADRIQFGPEDVLKRVKRKGDLYAPLLALQQKLPTIAELQKASLRSS